MTTAYDVIDQIKSRISLVEEVRKFAPDIKKKGKFWWACCPFHHEKTPSFHVREDEGHYHCFGCGAHGDVFKLHQELRGGTFAETLQHLATQTGVVLPDVKRDPQKEARKKDGYAAMEAASQHFQCNLNPAAKAYIEKRGIDEATRALFGIGYAADSWDDLRDTLVREGFQKGVLKEVGLTVSSDKGRDDYDRFRGRLMFPIHDAQDRVIAFGGRILDTGEPKYLNSSDTPLFSKSHTLYNLNRAREAIRKHQQALLVEGYMDVVALWQAGIHTAVAPLGTAVTPEQIQLLWRYYNAPIVCLDGDSAGKAAAERLAERILPFLKPGYTLQFVHLPEGEDPDTYVKQYGQEAFNTLCQSVESIEDVLWHKIIQGNFPKKGEERALVETKIKEAAQTIENIDLQKHMVGALKGRLWATITGKTRTFSSAATAEQIHVKLLPNSDKILALLGQAPQLINRYEEELATLVYKSDESQRLATIFLRAFLENRLEITSFHSYLKEWQVDTYLETLWQRIMLNLPPEAIEDSINALMNSEIQRKRRQNYEESIAQTVIYG